MSTYTLPDLPYDHAALEPHVDARIMELHHDKHHATYVKGANTALDKLADARDSGDFALITKLSKDLAFNLSGHVLHSVFWTCMSPDGGGEPEGELAAAIDDSFGSFDDFKAQLSEATTTVQGSGWGALAWEPIGRAPDHRAGLRPPEQRRAGLGPRPGHRRLGARLLPAVPQRQGVLGRGLLGGRRLGVRRHPLRRALHP